MNSKGDKNMDKAVLKNFAIWARRKLIADITYKAGLLGIKAEGIEKALPQSTKDVQFFHIGTKEPHSISGIEIVQRNKLVNAIKDKENQSNYETAYREIIEEVAYTWFNRLIAIRFMEVNDYIPSRVRILSSESEGKNEPDIVTAPFDVDLDYSPYERDRILQLKDENKLDEVFRMLFIKQCNTLNDILPQLFEKTNDYTELLLNISFTDGDGIVHHLVNNIPEDDFNVEKEGQVEVIGWMYQYYNTEPKDETFALLKKNVKITKERIPAATQLFTPDWIVRYMVENSLGRLWVEGHPNEELKSNWKYYLEEAEQEDDVRKELEKIREEYKTIKPEDIKIIDPCMGSGHILVYAFDVLMQIYESCGYSQREAAKSIIENNLYGLDIDKRAYQLAYFAVLMKARQYNRRILNGEIKYNIYVIEESNGINPSQLQYFGQHLSKFEYNTAKAQMEELLDTLIDAKEYGSIINVYNYNWTLLKDFVSNYGFKGQIPIDAIGLEEVQKRLQKLLEIAEIMARKYDVVITNPPYMGASGMGSKLSNYIKKNYPNSKSDMFSCCIEKGFKMVTQLGFISMITMESWMFLSSFKKMREEIINHKTIINMIHMPYLGKGGTSLGINFGTVAVIFSNLNLKNYSARYSYIRYYETNKEGVPIKFPTVNERYTTSKLNNISKIPGVPIAYWIKENVIKAFDDILIGNKYLPKFGMSTGNTEKFIRNWYEASFQDIEFKCTDVEKYTDTNKKWSLIDKGGEFRRWYGNRTCIVWWLNNGKDVKLYKKSAVRSPNLFFKHHISWTLVSSGKFSARYFEDGFTLDSASNCIYFKSEKSIGVLGYLNSKVSSYFLDILNPTINYSCGVIGLLPYKKYSSNIDKIVNVCVNTSKIDWDSFETSWDFTSHPLLKVGRYNLSGIEKETHGEIAAVSSKVSEECDNNEVEYNKYPLNNYSLELSFELWARFTEAQFAKLKANEEELNRIFIEIYGLQDELTPEVEDKDVTIRKADLGRDIRSFVSYAVGCMFGRYSLDVDGLAYAGGDWDGSKYQTFIPTGDNIIPISDEEYFTDDVVGLFCDFVKKTFGEERLESNLDFIAKALGNRGNTSREIIRNYFLKDFFKDHCKIYQKRPIYWLFDSGKENGFKALIYMHRYDENTIGNLRIDYLHRVQRVYDNEIVRMQDTINNNKNGKEVAAVEKRKEKLIKQLKETKEYDEKIGHLAQLRTSIDLDDGVKVNYEKVQTDKVGKKFTVLANIK